MSPPLDTSYPGLREGHGFFLCRPLPLARIDVLEKQVNALKDELASARELSENYQATNLLMQQQVNELQEENESFKKSAASEKSTKD